jgi:hypothetical protein
MSAHHDDDHPIHLPQPSFSPPLLGLGVMLLTFGVLAGPVLLVVGGVFLVIGIATWLIDDARAYGSASDPADGAHH